MKSPSPSALIQLQMEKPVYGGDCLSHFPASGGKPGKAAFVPLTLPGETVTGQITDNKRSFLKAELDQVLIPSPDRTPPECPHFGTCGGCQYQHADYPTQSEMKQQILRETLSRAGVLIPSEIASLAGEPWAYRNRIRLALTPTGDLAYRSRGSHNRIAIRECPIAAPILLKTARQIQAFLAQDTLQSRVSELELFTNHDQSQLQITLFSQAMPEQQAQTLLDNLHSKLPPHSGICLVIDDGALTSKILAQAGEPSLHYQASASHYRVDHGAFFQVNRWLIDGFIELVTPRESGQLAWDLYAGVGLFSRPLAARFSTTVAVESAPASYAALRQNLCDAAATAVASTTLDYLRRNREQREPRPDCIVLDPPRAGLGDEVTTLLNAIGAPRLTYVSCDPTTLARDLRALTLERYRIGKITLVDMFPQTFHIETVVELHRS